MAKADTIRARRSTLGLSQAELARRAGISRQALGAIEAGGYQPTVGVALRLARQLGESVEGLFGDQSDAKDWKVNADWFPALPSSSSSVPQVAALGRIGGRTVAIPLRAAGLALNPAGGMVTKLRGHRAEIASFNSPEEIDATLLIAGCDPAASTLADWMARHRAPARVVPIYCSSTTALDAVTEGYAHCAGVHIKDAGSENFNLNAVRNRLGRRPALVVTFARWEMGLAFRPDSADRISSVADLAQPSLRIANREKGSGARALLDAALEASGVRAGTISGYQRELGGHLEVANAIAWGEADAGITVRVAAEAYGLKFLPLQEERYDLVIPGALADSPLIRAMLDALNSRRFAREISQLCGYDTQPMGQVLAHLNAA